MKKSFLKTMFFRLHRVELEIEDLNLKSKGPFPSDGFHYEVFQEKLKQIHFLRSEIDSIIDSYIQAHE